MNDRATEMQSIIRQDNYYVRMPTGNSPDMTWLLMDGPLFNYLEGESVHIDGPIIVRKAKPDFMLLEEMYGPSIRDFIWYPVRWVNETQRRRHVYLKTKGCTGRHDQGNSAKYFRGWQCGRDGKLPDEDVF